MDANFCLKSRDRHILNDPSLLPGGLYFVKDDDYQAVMETFGDQEEVWQLSKCFYYMALTCL